jgi:nascent polypeptide-associated complex subunit alpha
MFPGVNPRQMQQMMRKMGIQQVDLPAREVIIRLPDKELVFSNPSVAKVNMMGQETFQLTGEFEERALSSGSVMPEISEDDIKTVMEQASVTRERAKKMLEETKGDLAEAIMRLTQSEE